MHQAKYMSEEIEIPKEAIDLYYKGRGGVVKQIHLLHVPEPGARVFTLADIQLLAREIGKVMQEDS
jgi:hypothetical protein